MALLKSCKKIFNTIQEKYTDGEGLVDYNGIYSDLEYSSFVLETCAIQKVSLGDMDYSTKLAFVINLYNLVINQVSLGEGCWIVCR